MPRNFMKETQFLSKYSLIAKIFISPAEPRLRAGWRLLIQTILLICLTILIVSLFSLKPIVDLKIRLREVEELLIFGGSIYLARRFLDKRSFGSLGLKIDRYAFFDIIAGMGVTFIVIGSMYIVMKAFGWIKFESFAWSSDSWQTIASQTLPFLMIFTLIGFNEELLWRGYWLQTIASGRNLFWGLILSSAVFGYFHLSNPNAQWVGAAGDFLIGLFLAYGYACTKQLWLPIGLHIGYNFFDSTVFGFPVSGWNIYSLIRINISGPEIWTGGAFGPEAGLIVLPALALGVIMIYLYTHQRWTKNNS